MSLIAIIKLIWANRAILWQILQWINQGLAWIEISAKLAEYDKAAKKAEETKDTSDLENLFKDGGNPPSHP